MANLVEFGRMFLSYGVLMLIIVAVMALGIFVGIKIAKNKNSKAAQENKTEAQV